MWRRLLLLALATLGLSSLSARTVEATVAKALSLTELTLLSHAVAVGTPSRGESRWEEIGGQQRIVTYTKVNVSRRVFGLGQEESEVTIRTLGGRIGDLGQIVHGEARLQRDRPSLLFLRRGGDSRYRVTGMAQGHYRVEPDSGGVLRVRPGGRGAHLLGGPLASAHLTGLDLDTAIQEILKARRSDG